MKVQQVMSKTVVRIRPEESVAVASRALTHYNIGVLPVCGGDGRLQGVLTDRDIVTRCLASGRSPLHTPVSAVMTKGVVAASPEMDAVAAAGIMAQHQVRRLPVLENGRLCGMVSLGDIARMEETAYDAGDALAAISSSVGGE